MSTGKILLGDSGAYGIGAGMLLMSLIAFSQGLVSLPFLAVLFFYPCFDFLVSVVRRLSNKQPMTSPDNDHFHNRLYIYFKSAFRSKTVANSATGLSVVLCTSGLALGGYVAGVISLESNLWLWVFLFQCVVYVVLFIGTGRFIRTRVNNGLA